MTGPSESPARRVEARAPGRVNLLGEHTDYNDGFVMPMALPFDTTMTITERDDRRVRLSSEGFDDVSFDLDDDPSSVPSWGRYVAGMARLLADDGLPVSGFEARIQTTIPVGASLSSSAALENATGFGLTVLAGETPDPVRIAKLGQRVENEVIGIQSGIMDQLISAIAVDGSAVRIDCRSLESKPIELPETTSVVIMDTMTRRELANSEYDLRREACERAALAIGVDALRDATIEQVAAMADGVDKRRATHVVTENNRVLLAEELLARGDIAGFGQLMNESHFSLQKDYEVSSPALDEMAAIAREHEACFGARMTGGGFAGSAVALIRAAGADAPGGFVEHVRSRWVESTGVVADIWVVEPSSGASAAVI